MVRWRILMGKYDNLNIFDLAKRVNQDPVEQVANMINDKSVSPSQRKRLERSLNKIDNIYKHAQNKLDYSAYEKYRDITDLDFVHFNAILGITMYEDYHWTESEDVEHGQITSLMERIQKNMRKYKNMGCSTKDVAKKLEELTGIVLVPDNEYK